MQLPWTWALASVAYAASYTEKHNEFRRLHGTAPLALDTELEREAEAWASFHIKTFGNRLTHQWEYCRGSKSSESVCASTGNSENLAWVSYNQGAELEDAVDSWYSEVKDVVWSSDGKYQGKTGVVGHLTQLLWKGTTKVGCGMAASPGVGTVTVCRYDPPGNYLRRYADNVADCDTTIAYKCDVQKCIPKTERCNGIPGDCNMPDKWCPNTRYCTRSDDDETGCTDKDKLSTDSQDSESGDAATFTASASPALTFALGAAATAFAVQ